MKSEARSGNKNSVLSEQATKVTGEKVFNLINDIAISKFSLNNDYSELSDCYMQYLTDWDIVRPQNTKKLHTLFLRFSGLFRNYVTSYCALIDQLNSAHKKINNVELEQNYVSQLKKTQMLEKGRFAGDFRNYCIHKRLPITRARIGISVKPDGTTTPKIIGFGKDSELSFQLSELLKWSGWSVTSKSYFQRFGTVHRDDVLIIRLVNDWQKSLAQFCRWFANEVQTLCAKEIDEYVSEMKAKNKSQQEFLSKIWENSSI